MRAFGIILIVMGLTVAIAFAIRLFTNPGEAEFLNLRISASIASWLPIFVGVAFVMIGVIMTRSAGRKGLD